MCDSEDKTILKTVEQESEAHPAVSGGLNEIYLKPKNDPNSRL